jgi:hypothetical protein
MEVLTSSSPYPSLRPASSSSSSVLDYRSSRQTLDSVSELTCSVDHALFVNFHGDSLRTGVSLPHSVRRSPASPHPFAPLTPIIASPITTPTPSMSTSTLYPNSDKEGTKEKLTAIKNALSHESDYLTEVNLAPIPASDDKVIAIVDKSPTWTSTPPTPPPKPPRYRSSARRASSSVLPSISLPVSLNRHAYSQGSAPKRRATLPPVAFSKPLPATPPSPPSPSLKMNQLSRPKQSLRLSGSPPRSDIFSKTRRSSSKPIFHVLDNGSDREEDGSGGLSAESPKEIYLEQQIESAGASENARFKAKRQDDIRRYHALVELLTTEEGYLMDLRELVNVSASCSISRPQ